MAFLSGTDSSVVYESLKEMKRENDYSKIEGRIGALFHVGVAASSILGGIFARFFPIWILMCGTAGFGLAALCISLMIREPKRNVYTHPRGTIYGFYKILRYVFL